MTEELKKELLDLLKEKGRIVKSRRNVNSKYRLGLRLKGLNVKDEYTLARFSGVVGYKFYFREKRARLISTKLVYELCDLGFEFECFVNDNTKDDKEMIDVLNEYHDKLNKGVEVIKVDEDLPF